MTSWGIESAEVGEHQPPQLVAHTQPDSCGDTFCRKYRKYVSDPVVVNTTLLNLEKNFESCFGETPSQEQMEQALQFVDYFLAEVHATAPTARSARHAMTMTRLIGADVIETAENIHELRGGE